MWNNNSIVNVWDLSKPATTLIGRISDAIGVLYEPTRIKRKAKAEAKAEQIKELANIETQALKQRTIQRFIKEEEQKQENIESIIEKVIPLLWEGATPENIEKDWISNFFDKSKLTSDEEMKKLWANILAWEANKPWTFSKRTINFMESLDKKDALLFTKLCSFIVNVWFPLPLVFDSWANIYKKYWINFAELKYLEWIWLISFETYTRYKTTLNFKRIKIQFGNNINLSVIIDFKKELWNDLNLWKVLFTSIGEELSRICNPERIEWFQDYVIKEWKKDENILNIKK